MKCGFLASTRIIFNTCLISETWSAVGPWYLQGDVRKGDDLVSGVVAR